MSTISVHNLHKSYGKVKAVDGISFEVKKGEIFGFLGPNGAGKTTTIRCMMDFLRPDDGEIKIFDSDAHIHSTKLKKEIGFLPGEVNLYADWTGSDHIHLLEKIRGKTTLDEKLVKKFDFDPNKKVQDLSTGNKQKLGLILALMHEPELLILDEPTMGLDPLLQQAIYEILQTEASKDTTIFMSSHNLSEVQRICDRVCIIKQGKLVATEKVSDLRQKRLYTVHVYFEKKIDKMYIEGTNIDVEKELDTGFILNIKEDINPFLQKLSELPVKDIEIGHSNLEEIFLEFYK